MSSTTMHVLSAALLGLLSGALSLEGFVLVPYWRSLASAVFAELHPGFASRLLRFFAPLTTAAVISSVVSAGVGAWRSDNNQRISWLFASSVLALLLLVFYRIYFHAANQRLPQIASAGDEGGLARELARWHRVHAARTFVCLMAFSAQLIALTMAP